jgi:hypothetical protein
MCNLVTKIGRIQNLLTIDYSSQRLVNNVDFIKARGNLTFCKPTHPDFEASASVRHTNMRAHSKNSSAGNLCVFAHVCVCLEV